MELVRELLDKIDDRTYKVGIVGLGYVGLPLALAFEAKGFGVLGLDIDDSKVDALLAGKSYIKHISSDDIGRMVAGGRFDATVDFSRAKEADALLLCVPTPLTEHRDPDMSYVVGTIEELAPHLRPGQLMVLESTTYPHTTTDLIAPAIEARGLTIGEDAFLAYSPEREDPGNPSFSTAKIPKVVGADDDGSRAIAERLYGAVVVEVVPVSSTAAAEAVKLTENIFRSINIALVNELKVIYDAMGIDVWEVIEAAKTKPFGFMPFYPGPGLGGHCIPIDPFYLTWKAREHGQTTRFIELAGEINTSMPTFVVQRVQDALNGQKKSLNGSRVLILGMAYKPNVDDMRESPSLRLTELLKAKGADVAYHDPYIPCIPKTREHPDLAGMESVSLDAETLAGFDVALVATDHRDVDYDLVLEACPLVVDTRNAYAGRTSDRIVRA